MKGSDACRNPWPSTTTSLNHLCGCVHLEATATERMAATVGCSHRPSSLFERDKKRKTRIPFLVRFTEPAPPFPVFSGADLEEKTGEQPALGHSSHLQPPPSWFPASLRLDRPLLRVSHPCRRSTSHHRGCNGYQQPYATVLGPYLDCIHFIFVSPCVFWRFKALFL